MEQYRILHVLGKLNRGGAETMVMNLYRKIDREKIQFDFIIHTDEMCEYTEEILKLGGRIFSVPRYTFFNHFTYKKAWMNFFDNHKEYKIIHGHVRSTAAIYLRVAKKNGLTTIAHSHSISSGKGISAIIKNILQYKIRYISDYFMGCSKKANEWLFGKKIANSDKCIVLKNGIETEKFFFNTKVREDIRERLELANENIVIGHIGRFSPEKNHKLIIKIFSKLYNNNNNYKLILIGNGEEKEKIINKCKKKNILNNVIFLESISNVYDYLQAMDIFIMPSKYEGLGMALIEAQVSGLKCFASNKIPIEARITNNVKFLNLNLNKWVKSIENCDVKRKNELNSDIKEYDINNVTKGLQQFYLKIWREE